MAERGPHNPVDAADREFSAPSSAPGNASAHFGIHKTAPRTSGKRYGNRGSRGLHIAGHSGKASYSTVGLQRRYKDHEGNWRYFKSLWVEDCAPSAPIGQIELIAFIMPGVKHNNDYSLFSLTRRPSASIYTEMLRSNCALGSVSLYLPIIGQYHPRRRAKTDPEALAAMTGRGRTGRPLHPVRVPGG